jgi:hypothetical protein
MYLCVHLFYRCSFHIRGKLVTKKSAVCKPTNRLSPVTKSDSTLILDFPAFQTVRKNVLLFISLLVYDSLL